MNGSDSQEKSGENSLHGNSSATPPALSNRIALYLNSYSTDGRYIQLQENELREKVAALNHYRDFGVVTHVFRDEGVPVLLHERRPGLQSLMAAVRAREVTLVMVPTFLELAAYPPNLFKVLQFFHEQKCGLRSLHEYLLFEEQRMSRISS